MHRFKGGDRVILARPHPRYGWYGIDRRCFGHMATIVYGGLHHGTGEYAYDIEQLIRFDGHPQRYVWTVFDCMLDPLHPSFFKGGRYTYRFINNDSMYDIQTNEPFTIETMKAGWPQFDHFQAVSSGLIMACSRSGGATIMDVTEMKP